MVLFRRLQQCMLDAREVGNTKLEISAQLLDIVSCIMSCSVSYYVIFAVHLCLFK